MRVFGLTIARTKSLMPVGNNSTFFGLIKESFAGAWQSNILAAPRSTKNVLAFSAVYACIRLISSDIAKMRLRLMQLNDDGTWAESKSSGAFLPVLRSPNNYQTRVQFIMAWLVSKLIHGNAYILKERDQRGVVVQEHVLDPCNVMPLVADNGDVFYRLKRDNLAEVPQDDDGVIVPASEIIHDRMMCFWHPLVGVSPLYACLTSALQGVDIQANSQKFFQNMSRPSGVLTAPGKIADTTAARIKKMFEENFGGDNIGHLAVLGDGLKYEAMTIPPIEAQLLGQLDWTAGDVARAFGVPPYKIGLDTNLTFTNAAQLNQDYYSQCLQIFVESIEVLQDEGLALPSGYRTEFDLEDLLRMDPLGQAETNGKRIGSGELAPNEARAKGNLPPVKGGETPYLQVQNYSLEALAKRDSQADPFASKTPAPTPAPEPAALPPPKSLDVDRLMRRLMLEAPEVSE